MIAKFMLGCALCATAMAAESPGRATADWLAGSATAAPGKPLATAIRLKLDAGWHSYWINPGESGLPTAATWQLPPGWHCGPLQHPAPMRFMTSGLTGFGHEGEVLFPVMVTPPENFTGTAELRGEISWLACSEAGCVPGKAQVKLSLTAGAPQASAHHAAIEAASRRVPRPLQDAALRLAIQDQPDGVLMEINAPPTLADPGRWDVYPATPDVIDPAAVIRFTPSGEGKWSARAGKSGYANGPLRQLTLMLVDRQSGEAIELAWPAR